jgi:hypothetical protein
MCDVDCLASVAIADVVALGVHVAGLWTAAIENQLITGYSKLGSH